MARTRRYWLFKSEPGAYSYDDLVRDGRTHWDGVRNYQARNLLRDDVGVGDGVLFYHSNAKPLAIVGLARVVRSAYPDHTAFEMKAKAFDAKSDADAPTWYMVDIEPAGAFPEPLTRERLATVAGLEEMMLLRRGARLSIQPVTPAEWRKILKLAGVRFTAAG